MSDNDPHDVGPIGRAAAGAIAGAFLGLAFFMVPAVLRRADGPDSAEGPARFLLAIGAAAAAGAVFGVAVGGLRIRGRAATIVQGMCLGAAIGVPAGSAIGMIFGKSGMAIGIFLGAPLGAIAGGLVGVVYPMTPMKEGPMPRTDGVHDRELDG